MTQKNLPSFDITSGLLFLALAFVWGTSFFFAGLSLREVPPITTAFHRVFWAVPALYLFIRLKGVKIPLCPKAWACYLVMGALNNAIPFSLIFWGQSTIGSGLASVLNGTTAIFSAVVAGLLLVDEPLTVRKILGAFVGLLGVAVIMGKNALANFDPNNLSQLAVLGAAMSYAFASVWGRKFLSTYHPQANALGMLTGATILLLPAVLLMEGFPSLDLSPHSWASLLALGLFSTALAYPLYFEILVRAGSANLMLVTLVTPPIAVALSYVFLGEEFRSQTGQGFILIALGLVITDGRVFRYLIRKRQNKREADKNSG